MRKANISLSCSRQHTSRRKLLQEDHSDFVASLMGLVEEKIRSVKLSWMLLTVAIFGIR
jgi:hypothetical protein